MCSKKLLQNVRLNIYSASHPHSTRVAHTHTHTLTYHMILEGIVVWGRGEIAQKCIHTYFAHTYIHTHIYTLKKYFPPKIFLVFVRHTLTLLFFHNKYIVHLLLWYLLFVRRVPKRCVCKSIHSEQNRTEAAECLCKND